MAEIDFDGEQWHCRRRILATVLAVVAVVLALWAVHDFLDAKTGSAETLLTALYALTGACASVSMGDDGRGGKQTHGRLLDVRSVACGIALAAACIAADVAVAACGNVFPLEAGQAGQFRDLTFCALFFAVFSTLYHFRIGLKRENESVTGQPNDPAELQEDPHHPR